MVLLKMELFTEIYNCYFQIVDEICKTAATTEITEKIIENI